jgi:hypothetical protein
MSRPTTKFSARSLMPLKDGYWVLDTVERNHGGRNDVSTVWNDVSDTSLAGKTIWKWGPDPKACTAVIEARFSWTAVPEFVDYFTKYNITVKEEQMRNSCTGVGSHIKIYYGMPADISNPIGQADGPSVYFGEGDGLVGENTLPIYGSNYNDRGYAILVLCWMYQEWYAVQYRYKWVEGKIPAGIQFPHSQIPTSQTSLILCHQEQKRQAQMEMRLCLHYPVPNTRSWITRPARTSLI